MLPVTHGIEYTKSAVLHYTILMALCTLLPYLTGMSGLIYLTSAIILNAIFIYYAVRLKFAPVTGIAMKTFGYSIVYLMCLFIVLLVDHYFMITLVT